MDYKIVFFDVDDTMTHHEDGSISTSTKDAVGLGIAMGNGHENLKLVADFVIVS